MKNPISELPLYLTIYKKYLGLKIYIILLLAIFAGLAESFGIVMLLPIFKQINKSTEVVSVVEESGFEQDVYLFILDILSVMGMEGSIANVIVLIGIMFLIKGCLTFFALGFSAILRGDLLMKLKNN